MRRFDTHAISGALVSSVALSAAFDILHVSSAMCVSARHLRNLHQYPVARHKSLVRERLKYSRNWYLQSGNNTELSETIGHEREALENFGEYQTDSDHDKFVLSTATLKDLPAHERLSALMAVMKDRWQVKDGQRGFDKAKMLLEALECYSEMLQLGRILSFDMMKDDDQDAFLQTVSSCNTFARRCVHSHPDAVAIMIRAATICDELGCGEKRDETLNLAERSAANLGSKYAFAREQEDIQLTPIRPLDENTRRVREQSAESVHRAYPWMKSMARRELMYVPPSKKMGQAVAMRVLTDSEAREVRARRPETPSR